MKVIQSFWSKPFLEQNEEEHLRSVAGWPDENCFARSCLLSCLNLREYYDQVHLITDSYGKKLLIDTYKVPYSSFSLELDDLSELDSGLWAIGKVYTYGLQNEPFLHVDNDVFLYDKLPEALLNSDLVVQNVDRNAPYYEKVLKVAGQALKDHAGSVEVIKSYSVKSENRAYGCNAGIIGGNDFGFFHEFKAFVFEALESLNHSADIPDFGLINMFLEQTLFLHQAESNQIRINALYQKMDKDFNTVLNFEFLPQSKYIHCIGSAKKKALANEQILARLIAEYPQYANHEFVIPKRLTPQSDTQNSGSLINQFLTSKGLPPIKDLAYKLKNNEKIKPPVGLEGGLWELDEMIELERSKLEFRKRLHNYEPINDIRVRNIQAINSSDDLLSLKFQLSDGIEVKTVRNNRSNSIESQQSSDKQDHYLLIYRKSMLAAGAFEEEFLTGFHLLIDYFTCLEEPVSGHEFYGEIIQSFNAVDTDRAIKFKTKWLLRSHSLMYGTLTIV